MTTQQDTDPVPSDIAALFHALLIKGHERLHCEYSGEGDEGWIHDIELDGTSLGSERDGAGAHVRLLPGGASDFAALEAWLSETIYAENRGYEDCDGGGGKITVNLRTGHLTHEPYHNVLEVEQLEPIERDLLAVEASE